MRKRKIALLCVLVLLITGVAGVLSGCEPKSIDEIWNAQLYEEEDGSQAVRIYGLTGKGRKETRLVLPETIDGYPVKRLQAKRNWLATVNSGGGEVGYADLGELKYLTIEPSVFIGQGFFEKCKINVLEFTNDEPSFLKSSYNIINAGIILIPENYSYAEYFTAPWWSGGYHRSDIVNGYLIKDGIFIGYYGEELDIVIPEGVKELGNLMYTFPINSIRFPKTLIKVKALNGFKNYQNITVYVSKNTIIEDRAFMSSVNIIYY
jgi:hypothetical protein